MATDRPLAVLDTKNTKSATIFPRMIFTKWLRTRQEFGCQLAILVYPRPHEEVELHYGPVTVRSVCFDLSSPMDHAGDAFRDRLLSLLKAEGTVQAVN